MSAKEVKRELTGRRLLLWSSTLFLRQKRLVANEWLSIICQVSHAGFTCGFSPSGFRIGFLPSEFHTGLSRRGFTYIERQSASEYDGQICVEIVHVRAFGISHTRSDAEDEWLFTMTLTDSQVQMQAVSGSDSTYSFQPPHDRCCCIANLSSFLHI